MANPNIRQKVAKLPNNAQLKTTLDDYMTLGFVLHQMINLAPVSNEILIVYYDPAVDPVPPN
jgi:hypothetical protein